MPPRRTNAAERKAREAAKEAASRQQHHWCLRAHLASKRGGTRALGRYKLLSKAQEEFGEDCVVTDATLRNALSRLGEGDDAKGAAVAVGQVSDKKCLTEEKRVKMVDSIRTWSM